MKNEWVAIFVIGLLLLVGLVMLARIVLRSSRQKAFALPVLPDNRVLFPIGPLFGGNDEAAATEVLGLLSAESTVIIALLYEVPRAIALEKATAEETVLALQDRVGQLISAGGYTSEHTVVPCRNALEEVLRLIGNQKASAVFVRLDATPEADLMETLLQRASCTVLLSHTKK